MKHTIYCCEVRLNNGTWRPMPQWGSANDLSVAKMRHRMAVKGLKWPWLTKDGKLDTKRFRFRKYASIK